MSAPIRVVAVSGSNYYVIPKTASGPASVWFSPSTRSNTCLNYGVALDATTAYSSMYDTNSKKTLLFKRALP